MTAYGIVAWLVIGGLAGWVGSMIMGTNARQGIVANVIIGVIGAVVGGFITQLAFGTQMGTAGLFVTFAVALLGACIVIALWKLISSSGGRGRLAH